MRTFQYRLYPTKAQEKALQLQLEVSRHVYNMALEERRLAWELEEKSMGKREGYLLAKQYKKTFPQSKTVHSHVLQAAIEDLDRAFHAFFRRVKAGEEPGYPRFKSHKRWHRMGFKQYGSGFKVEGRRLKISGVGRIKVRWHRPHQGEIRTCRVVRKAGRWYVRNQHKDFFDKLVYELVHTYDVIAIEDLKIRNMVKNHPLSKSILDAGWGYFKKRLIDKAADAGRSIVLIDPAYTSKSCSNCGALFEGLTLAHRWVECECGLSLDRDHNAALNILKRAGRVREPERSGLPQTWLRSPRL
ncbi:MAG: IS200/IS605 family element transposase accessory protein TnpB [Anaerolineae bacterium]|nr:MAG: IS200/IS605 family element transposase accessory protein TnpB [Anaerolineae bacterium]